MDDNTIEIRDDEINVEEIMEKIRENIRRRQEAGELPSDPNTLIPSFSCINTTTEFNESYQRDLATISSTWDIHNNTYFISSHHKYLGKFLITGRQTCSWRSSSLC